MENQEVKFGRVQDAMKRYSLGKTKLREAAKEAGAVVKIGKAYRVNYDVMDRYFDQLTEQSTQSG